MSTHLQISKYAELNVECTKSGKFCYFIFDENLKVLASQTGYNSEKLARIAGKQTIKELNLPGYDEEYVGMH